MYYVTLSLPHLKKITSLFILPGAHGITEQERVRDDVVLLYCIPQSPSELQSPTVTPCDWGRLSPTDLLPDSLPSSSFSCTTLSLLKGSRKGRDRGRKMPENNKSKRCADASKGRFLSKI